MAVRTSSFDPKRWQVRIGLVGVGITQTQNHPRSVYALRVVRQRPHEKLTFGAVGLADVPHDEKARVFSTHD